jgi:hypothetical protein
MLSGVGIALSKNSQCNRRWKMISAWWLLPAFGLGLIIGIAMIALLNSAKEADDRMEKFMNNLDTITIKRKEDK